MTTANASFDIKQFAKDCKGRVLIAGYGSLLSAHSRKTFSNIHTVSLPVLVNNWERGWLTRSQPEKQTYASAQRHQGKKLTAKLIPLVFDSSFETREQDYRFTPISLKDLDFGRSRLPTILLDKITTLIDSTSVYICETLSPQSSNPDFPVHFSYLNTCLAGAFEDGGSKGIHHFFEHTAKWSTSTFKDDSKHPFYPRYTPTTNSLWNTSDLLKKYTSVDCL